MNEQIDRRLEAAENTVAVLKKKVLDLYNRGTESGIHRQLEAARRRDEENRRRRDLMEMRAADLEAYSARLEVDVENRTRAIKTILDNVTFGFLIVDRDLQVQEGHTLSCHRLLEAERIAGRTLKELLDLDRATWDYFLLGVDQVFEDIVSEEMSLSILPSRFEIQGRILRFEPRAVRGPKGEVTGLLLTISDVTLLEATQKQSEVNRQLVSILRQKDAFRMFLADTKALIERARASMVRSDVKTVRRDVHTIKGNAASYGLSDVVRLIHDVEEEPEMALTSLDRIEAALRCFVEEHRPILEIDFDAGASEDFLISSGHIDELKELAGSLQGRPATRLERWTAEVLQKPAYQLIGPIEEFTAKLAVRLEKEVELSLEGKEVLVHSDTIRPIFRVLPHLIRNALDHGIERMEERGAKPQAGQLRISVRDVEGAYEIEVVDDGRGIDVEVLGEKALKKGLVHKETLDKMGDEERLQLVFVDNLSSIELATEISGRGLGMQAVRDEVTRRHGTIVLSSRKNLGTRVLLRIPKPGPLAAVRAA